MPFTADKLMALSRRCGGAKRLWVAYSGGVDSHVLLHRVCALRGRLPPVAGAAHVNHGIHADAAEWARHCAGVCAGLGVSLRVLPVVVGAGGGVEERARKARYRVLADLLGAGDVMLAAHHEDDQAETFLLQALRGGGPWGLAAMPVVAALGRGWLARPMLDVPRRRILRYAAAERLRWVEDDSNIDTRFDRAFLREEAMPLLRRRWPATARTLARAAAHTADMVGVAEEALANELATVAGGRAGTLGIARLSRLPLARRALLIRLWCKRSRVKMPATAHIAELNRQLRAAGDRQIHIRWPGGEFRRYGDDLFVMSPLSLPSSGPGARDGEYADWEYTWDGKGVLRVPELGGALSLVESAAGTGPGVALSAQWVARGLRARPRRGGGRFKSAGDKHTRSLKAVFQYHRVPPWQRRRLPLIYIGDELAAVADLAVSAAAAAAAGEAGWSVVWRPDEG